VTKLLLVIAVLGAGVGVLAATGTLGKLLDSLPDNTCPYGSNSGSRDTLSCKPRPAPKGAEGRAALDGSALTKALTAFARTSDAGKPVVGVGLNRWGETTFALPTGATAFGEPRERFVTFDHEGGSPPQGNAQRRGYALVTRSSTTFDVDRLRPGALRKALARIGRGGSVRFQLAELATGPLGPGLGWLLRFDTSASAGVLVRMNPSGSGLCGLDRATPLRGIKACSPASLMGTGAAGGGSASRDTPAAPPPPATDQLKQARCVQRAAPDVAAIQRCLR
jgi:hypothetical protein